MGNQLGDQRSTYLTSHAGDPVNWMPWGPKAFEIAKREGRAVLVSVGYDSCHWCHVMQRESFRDEQTAKTLNEQFVSVKVDRELRPDVDHFYMTYTTLAIGHAGWPMTVFADPQARPFFAGTYFPKEGSPGMPAFSQVIEGVESAYSSDPTEVGKVGDEAVLMVSQVMRPQPLRPVDGELLELAVAELMEMVDEEHGGLGEAPKFPQAPIALFLLARAEAGDERCREVATEWTYAMIRSGTYDQVGGGLYRYSTDAAWQIPHFEKMLYDNALLLSTIAAQYRIEPSEELARAARKTAAFLENELAAPNGGYYSSLDAETGGVEGGTYTWTWTELVDLLDSEEMALAGSALGATEAGNWEGTNNLSLREGWPKGQQAAAIEALLAKLESARSKRPQPKLITNLLVDWNALAARGLIDVGVAIDDREIIEQGMRVVEWLRESAISGDRVLHAVGDESVADLDLIEDIAALILALLAAADGLSATAGDEIAASELALREEASRLLEAALGRFDEGAVLFMTGEETELPLRPISYDDAPTPSGAAMLTEAYWRLRPNDAAGLDRLLVPATGIVTRAPYMSGTWLRVMDGVTVS